MAIKKSYLSKLKRELLKYNIKAQSITRAAETKDKSKDYIRKVLNGDKVDTDDIISFLADCVIEEGNRIKKVLNKIDTL